LYIQNLVRGYVFVSVEGFFIEKVINKCKKDKINLMSLRRKSSTLITAQINVNSFKDFSRIVKKNKCRLKIQGKKGLPFLIRKYKKRKIFVISLIIFLLVMFSLSRFIWNIEITGNNNVSDEVLIKILESEGLKIGSLKKNVNLEDIVNKIRMERSDVSWVGIKIVGTNAVIEIVETGEIPEVVDEEEHCNIVATKDAMIDSISAQNGTLKVKKGDIVKAGTILIAGEMEGKYTGTRYVHSMGTIIGKVWYREKARAYYKQKINIQTGKVENKYSIKVNNFVINFFKSLSKFEKYDTIRTDKKLKISSNFYVPFVFEKNTNYEIKEEEIEYSKDEAKEQAINKARERLKEKICGAGDIVNEYINTYENEGYIDVEVTYEVLENIGTEEKIALWKDERHGRKELKSIWYRENVFF